MTLISTKSRLTTADCCTKRNEWKRGLGGGLRLTMAAIAVILAGTLMGCADESSDTTPSAKTEELVRYLAGMEVLKASDLSSAQLRVRHQQLRELTGISPEQAALYLKQMQSHPHKWKRLQKRMLDALHESQQSSKE
jgi:hypothetical protein